MKPRAAPLLVLLTLALALTARPVLPHDGTHAPAPREARVISGEEPLAIPNFPVALAGGRAGGLRDMLPKAAPVIIGFTYTNCQSLCGITNAVLLWIDGALAENGLNGARIVTISIDPLRDTPERLDAVRHEIGASERWLWVTAGPQGTQALLDALRFPPGPVEDHDPVYLVGRPCAGSFTRIVGLPDPDALYVLAANLPECAG